MPEKTRTPVTGGNSPSNNKHGRNFLVHNDKPGFFQFVREVFARFARFINTNFSAIMGFWAGTYTVWLFIDSGPWQRVDILVILFCVLCISYRKYSDKQNHESTFDRIANFKRFTHKWPDGRVTVRTAEIQQIIVYLYEIENFLGKPDTGNGHVASETAETDPEHAGSRQEADAE